MRPVTAAAIRRRGRRRVADENRKRAVRACERCKSRKVKCIESCAGPCQKCLDDSLLCSFESQSPAVDLPAQRSTPVAAHASPVSDLPNQASEDHIIGSPSVAIHPSTAHTGPLEQIPWPRFLSHLRDVFSLDHHDVPDEYPTELHPTTRPATFSAAELSRLRKAADAFPPRHVSDFLLRVCIEYGTDSFFYFDQAQLLAEVDQFYTDPASILRYDASFICLVLSALALGAQRSLPLGLDNVIPPLNSENEDPGQIFFDQAKSLIPDVIERSCLRAIQATFILGVYLLPQTAVGSSYIYIGIALRKAVSFDLHHRTDSSISAREREIQCRLWWSIYALERTLTVKLNRSRSVNVEIITIPLPSPLPLLDDVQPFDNVQHQLANARLVKILDVLAESENASTSTTNTQLADRYARDLKEWKRSLPAECILEKIRSREKSYRAVMHLHMNYYFAWITMGRLSLVNIVRAKLRYLFGRDAQPPVFGEGIENISRYAIKGATKMLRLFDNLARSGNMVRFSFTDFQACSIATTITLLAGVLERDATFESRVEFAMNCLRKMSIGNAAAASGVKFLDALRSIANEATCRLEQRSSSVSVPDSAPGESSSRRPGYKEWGEWLSKTVQSPPNAEIRPVEDHLPANHIARSPRLESWPHRATNSSWVDGWSYDEAQGAETSTNLSQEYEAEIAGLAHSSLNDDFFSPYHDEQTFLLGLTGLDVLDF